MKTAKALKIINLMLGIDFLIIAVTAILNNLIQATGFYFIFHAVPGFIFLVLTALHLFLNRRWIQNNYLKKKELPTENV